MSETARPMEAAGIEPAQGHHGDRLNIRPS